MDTLYGVGRISPDYAIDDSKYTTSRSVGYGSVNQITDNQPTLERYGTDGVSWVQTNPGSLHLSSVGSVGEAIPGFNNSGGVGRSVGYGVPMAYAGFTEWDWWKKTTILGVPMIAIALIGAGLYMKKRTGKWAWQKGGLKF